MGTPGLDKNIAQLAAGLDEERARSHRRVAHFQVQYLFWAWRPSVGVVPKPVENRFQRGLDNGFGQLARRVVGTRTTALLTGLQHHGAGGHKVRRGVPVDDGVQCGADVGKSGCGANSFARLVGDLAVGVDSNPLGALRGHFGQQCVQINGGRGAVLLRRLDRHRRTGGHLEPEPHHRLVDGADVLHVQRPVRDALAVQHEQLVQHSVDRAVRDERRFDALVDLPSACYFVRSAFQKAVAVGVEEGAVAARKVHGARAGTVVDHAEKREKLCVGTEAPVHGVRMERVIFGQPFVQPRKRVSVEECLVLGQHVPFLRVQQEDEAEDEGEKPLVYFVRLALVVTGVGSRVQEAAQQLPILVVSGLEPPQQFVEGVQDLLRQPFADLVLVLAALLQESREAIRPTHAQKPALAQQQAHGGADGAARRLSHVGHVEVEPARAFALWRRHQPDRGAVAQEASGSVRLPQQPLHTAVGRDVWTGLGALHAIQVVARPVYKDQQLPSGLVSTSPLCQRPRTDRKCGAQHLAGIGQRHFKLGRDRAFAGACVASGVEVPVEHL